MRIGRWRIYFAPGTLQVALISALVAGLAAFGSSLR